MRRLGRVLTLAVTEEVGVELPDWALWFSLLAVLLVVDFGGLEQELVVGRRPVLEGRTWLAVVFAGWTCVIL